MTRQPPHSHHWQVLGLSPDANIEDINRAYRAAVRRNHPDSPSRDTTPAGPSLAELQRARHQLLNHHAHAAASQQTAATRRPDPSTPPRDHVAEHGKHRHRRTDGGAPDLIAGPVLYHGPTSPR